MYFFSIARSFDKDMHNGDTSKNSNGSSYPLHASALTAPPSSPAAAARLRRGAATGRALGSYSASEAGSTQIPQTGNFPVCGKIPLSDLSIST